MTRRTWIGAIAAFFSGWFTRPAKAVNPFAIPPEQNGPAVGPISESWDGPGAPGTQQYQFLRDAIRLNK